MKTITKFIYFGFASLALAFLTLSQTVRAVVPPPDGGYPGFTTAEGNSALQHLTTGVGNTATGWHSLFTNSTGNLNTAVGAGTLLFNTGDNNTATGALALLNNTSGNYNTGDGAFALLSNTEGSGNTASGYQALYNNTGGSNNAAFGYVALINNTTSFNTAFGSQTLVFNTSGFNNTAIGYQALVFNNAGDNNVACGYQALYNNTGDDNIAIGGGAGYNLTNGSGNIDIGNQGLPAEQNVIRIGHNHSATYVAGIAGQTVGAGGTTCYVDNLGKLGVFLSARRYKQDIHAMDEASKGLLSLRPVTFRYKPECGNEGIPQFGLVAEEVAEVNPDLVTRDDKGQIVTVRYDAVNAMLLNEFLKEHCKNEEQEATIAELREEIAVLTAGLQKVSAQLELSKPALQTVKNTD